MIKNSLHSVQMPSELGPGGSGLSVLICSIYKYHSNWMAYSNWYSVYKNLPHAKSAISAGRSSKIDHCLYNWVHKCNDLRYHLHTNVGERMGLPYLNKLYGTYVALSEGIVKQPLVVLESDMLCVSDFSLFAIKKLNEVKFATNRCPYKGVEFSGKPVGPVWFFNNQPLEKLAGVINTLKTLKGRDHLDLLALSKFYGDEVEIVDELGTEVNENNMATFTHYKDGCGNFQVKDWEKGKIMAPFHVSYALQTTDMSVNERKVLNLWSQMRSLWEAINQVKM